jgi:hypothetical protein
VIENLRRFTDLFFNDFLLEHRSGHILDLQRSAFSLASHSRSGTFWRDLSLERELASFFRAAALPVVSMTNAFSATIRLYDPATNRLRKLYEIGEPEVRKVDPNDQLDSIPLVDKRSLNARVFSQQHPEYISNVGGARKTLPHRVNTLSEFCLPIWFRQTCIGTVNFESPVADGLRPEAPFLTAISESLSHFVTLLLSANDRFWLSRTSRHEANLHEVNNQLRDLARDGVLTQTRVEQIARHLRRRRVAISDKRRPIATIKDTLSDYLMYQAKRIASPSVSSFHEEEARFGCRFVLRNWKLLVSGSRLDLISLILSNLISNVRSHSTWRRDRIEIRHNGRFDSPLRIAVHASRGVDERTARALGLQPIRSTRKNGRDRAGMFLSGVLARELGGFVFVQNSTSELRLWISLPLSQPTKEDPRDG